MRQDTLECQLLEIIETSFAKVPLKKGADGALCLSENDMFRLWNILGEELGIDLSLATTEQRRILFEACHNGQRLVPREFGSLLWLMYYAEPHFQ